MFKVIKELSGVDDSLKTLIKRHLFDKEPFTHKAIIDITDYFRRCRLDSIDNQIELDIVNDFLRFIRTGQTARYPSQLLGFYIDDKKEDSDWNFFDAADQTLWQNIPVSYPKFDDKKSEAVTKRISDEFNGLLGSRDGKTVAVASIAKHLPITSIEHVGYMLEAMYVFGYKELFEDEDDD